MQNRPKKRLEFKAIDFFEELISYIYGRKTSSLQTKPDWFMQNLITYM